MAKKIIDLRKEIKKYKIKTKLLQIVDCSSSENKEFYKMRKAGDKLPDDVYNNYNVLYDDMSYLHYRIRESGLNEKEIKEYLFFKQLDYLRTIKNSVLFFVTLATISLSIGFIVGFFTSL